MSLITILSTGSRGDTQPYIALGKALQKAGQQVRLAAFENYESFVKDNGLEFFPIKGDVSRDVSSKVMNSAANADNPLKILFSFRELQKLVFDLQEGFFNACEGADVVVYHPGAAIGYFAAQHFGIPSVLATPFPMAPTGEYSSMILYDKIRGGRMINLLTHRMLTRIMWSASEAPVKKFLKKRLGHIPADFGCPFPKQVTQTHPTIISCSDYVFPTPKDWPADVHNTGYWFLDEEVGWTPHAELERFLQSGEAPIYFGFGSLGLSEQANKAIEMVLQVLKQTGRRGVLATGWGAVDKNAKMSDDILVLESAPHSWLFPKMAAVVHHGGAGTTAEGLRAGVPSIVIPFSNDQFAWGRRVFELGVGPRAIPQKSLTVEKLSFAINLALSVEMVSAARALGNKIGGENGADEAAKIILNTLE